MTSTNNSTTRSAMAYVRDEDGLVIRLLGLVEDGSTRESELACSAPGGCSLVALECDARRGDRVRADDRGVARSVVADGATDFHRLSRADDADKILAHTRVVRRVDNRGTVYELRATDVAPMTSYALVVVDEHGVHLIGAPSLYRDGYPDYLDAPWCRELAV